MSYEQLLERVSEHGAVGTEEAAERAIRATLKTLGECLPPAARRRLTSVLSKELTQLVLAPVDVEPLPLEEFFNRVAARSDVRYRQGVRYAEAVMDALQQVMARGDVKHIRRALPRAYGQLFEANPTGPLSPQAV